MAKLGAVSAAVVALGVWGAPVVGTGTAAAGAVPWTTTGRYGLPTGHPVDYAWLTGAGYVDSRAGMWTLSGKGGLPAGHPADYAYLAGLGLIATTLKPRVELVRATSVVYGFNTDFQTYTCTWTISVTATHGPGQFIKVNLSGGQNPPQDEFYGGLPNRWGTDTAVVTAIAQAPTTRATMFVRLMSAATWTVLDAPSPGLVSETSPDCS
jgi:hypothetical protein